MGEARKNSKTITYYLDCDIVDKIEAFSKKTYRSKSKAIEMLVTLGLKTVAEQGIEIEAPFNMVIAKAADEPTPEPVAKRKGRQPKAVPEPVAVAPAVAKPRRKKAVA